MRSSSHVLRRDALTFELSSHSVNIGNAAILGLKTELDLVTGTKYNTALTIFFVPYILLEIPLNILLKKFKPHVWCTFVGP